jgi:hypothetical protein
VNQEERETEIVEKKSRTTAEELQVFKEKVTAIIGIVIVAFTLFFVLLAFFGKYAANAKDILLFMEGLVGVVLGYYFGRVPAEARAQQAEKTAESAEKEAKEAIATASATEKRLEMLRKVVGDNLDRARREREEGITREPTPPGEKTPYEEDMERLLSLLED